MSVDWVVVKLPATVEYTDGDIGSCEFLTHVPVTSALKLNLYESRVTPGDKLWSQSWDIDRPETLPVEELVGIDRMEAVEAVDTLQ